MAVINPGHLLDQADRLVASKPPRQADLRRAISAAYYGVFHYLVTIAADEFVGVTKRNSGPYTLGIEASIIARCAISVMKRRNSN